MILEIFNTFPITCMSLISIIVLAIAYRLIRYGLRIKIGNSEIDADNIPDEKQEPTQERKTEES